jgi:hypothetical protein
VTSLLSSIMLPRRALQLLLHRVTPPRPQIMAFAAAVAVKQSKSVSSSGGIALEAAVKKVQESATAKFDETVDVAGRATRHSVCQFCNCHPHSFLQSI